MIVCLAGTVGAPAPSPTPDAPNTSTPLAHSSVSSVTADPDTVPVCTSSTVGIPATDGPAVAFSENDAVPPGEAGAVSEVHPPASACTPDTNEEADEAEPN